MKRTVHAETWRLLTSLGVQKLFGNPGSTELPFLAGMPLTAEYVLGLHEAAVVAMADAYAQASGRTTLVNLHTAAGVGNAMGAILNAKAGHSPLVITAGQQARAMLALEPLLTNADATTLPKPAVKWAFEPPRAQDVPAAMERAFRLASLPPAGPVFLSLPMDDWQQPAEMRVDEPCAGLRRMSTRTQPPDEVLVDLARRLNAARNPVLVVGAAVDASPGGFAAAAELATLQALPLWLAPNASRVGCPTSHPHFRGALPSAIRWLSDALAGHDLIVVAGAPIFDYYPYDAGPYIPPGSALVALFDDPDAAARAPVGEAILGDPGLALARMCELAGRADRPPPVSPGHSRGVRRSGPMTSSEAFEALGSVFPANGILVSETMNGAKSMWRHVKFRQPGSFYFCAAGGLGFGLPAGVGAKLARPDRPVLAVSGDGGAQYGIQALYTAVRYAIPAIFLLLENGEYGVLKGFGEYLSVRDLPGLDLGGLDYQAIASGYGLRCTRVETAESVASVVGELLRHAAEPHLVIASVLPGDQNLT
jgi:benzoylformate decarboxylase